MPNTHSRVSSRPTSQASVAKQSTKKRTGSHVVTLNMGTKDFNDSRDYIVKKRANLILKKKQKEKKSEFEAAKRRHKQEQIELLKE